MSEWTPEQQAEHRRIWVEALRSGKYQQAQGQLRSEDGRAFCCLGVACDISGLGEWEAGSVMPNYGVTEDDYSASFLPLAVERWLGWKQHDGSSDLPDSLLSMNDGDPRASFAEIADIIESEPPGLIATPEPAKPEGEL